MSPDEPPISDRERLDMLAMLGAPSPRLALDAMRAAALAVHADGAGNRDWLDELVRRDRRIIGARGNK